MRNITKKLFVNQLFFLQSALAASLLCGSGSPLHILGFDPENSGSLGGFD